MSDLCSGVLLVAKQEEIFAINLSDMVYQCFIYVALKGILLSDCVEWSVSVCVTVELSCSVLIKNCLRKMSEINFKTNNLLSYKYCSALTIVLLSIYCFLL